MFSKLFTGIYWALYHNLYKEIKDFDTSILTQKGFSEGEILAVINYIAEKNSGIPCIWNTIQPRPFNEPELQHISVEARTAIQLFQKANLMDAEETEELIEHIMEDNLPNAGISYHQKVGLDMVCKMAFLMFVQTGSPYKKDHNTPNFTGEEKIC
jgi:uncharacterized protein Smg (DUF494 family)